MSLHTTTAGETLLVLGVSLFVLGILGIIGHIILYILVGNPAPKKRSHRTYIIGAVPLFVIPTLYFYTHVYDYDVTGWRVTPHEWYLYWLVMASQMIWHLCWTFTRTTPRNSP